MAFASTRLRLMRLGATTPVRQGIASRLEVYRAFSHHYHLRRADEPPFSNRSIPPRRPEIDGQHHTDSAKGTSQGSPPDHQQDPVQRPLSENNNNWLERIYAEAPILQPQSEMRDLIFMLYSDLKQQANAVTKPPSTTARSTGQHHNDRQTKQVVDLMRSHLTALENVKLSQRALLGTRWSLPDATASSRTEAVRQFVMVAGRRHFWETVLMARFFGPLLRLLWRKMRQEG